MKNKAIILIIWATSLAGSYGLAVSLSRKSETQKVATLELEMRQQKKEIARDLDSNNRFSKITHKLTVDKLFQSLSEIQDLNFSLDFNEFKDYSELWEKVKLLSEEEVYKLYNKLYSKQSNSIDGKILNMIYSRLASLNPEAALTHCMNNHHRVFQNKILDIWAQKAPFVAFEWLTKNVTTLQSHSRVGEYILKHMARLDLLKAIESIDHIKKHQYPKLFGFTINGLSAGVERSEEFKSIASIFSMKEDYEKELTSLTRNWSEKFPKDAMEWAIKPENISRRKELVDSIKRNWLLQTPQIAANWLMENEVNKQKTIEEIASSWTPRQYESLIDFIDSRNDIDKTSAKEAAYTSLAWQTVGFDNTLAYKLANNILKDSDRIFLKHHIIYQAMGSNVKAAKSFLDDDFSEEEKTDFIRQFQQE